MSGHTADHDKLWDLLAAKATEGLSAGDERELSRVSSLDPAADLDDAAAALDLAIFTHDEPLPAHLHARLVASGQDWMRRQDAPIATIEPSPRSSGAVTWLGWLAAAAVAGFALLSNMPKPTPSLESQRSALLAVSDVRRADWVSLPDSPLAAPSRHQYDRGISGDVVWSDARDEGYMRIAGLAPNDPTQFEYQLWIFDAERPVGDLPQFRVEGLPELLTQRPVDGGVFDVSSTGEAVIPIDAKLPVGKAVIFAVTVEPPGGSVVSKRDVVFLTIVPG